MGKLYITYIKPKNEFCFLLARTRIPKPGTMTVESLCEEFKQICKSGDVDKFDVFHKQHCANIKECNGNYYESECDHDEVFWKSGFQGAFDGNHLHIVKKLYDLYGHGGIAKYDALKDPNVKREIIEYLNETFDMVFMDSYYSFRTGYMAVCERGDIDIFEYLGFHNILKNNFDGREHDNTQDNTKDVKDGFEIACKKDHTDLMIYLQKLYKECGIRFVCDACGEEVPGSST